MTATFEDIYNYEAAVEDAWISILQNGGQDYVYPEHSDKTKKTPYIEVQLTNVVATGHRRIWRKEQLWDWWNGELISRVITNRGQNSDAQRPALTTIRREAQRFAERFTGDVMPFHEMSAMKESALIRGFDPKLLVDFSEVRHQIVFHVRDDTWPK